MLLAASARSSIIANGQREYLTVFGFNKDGLLGLADKNIARPCAVPFEFPLKITKVCCGFKHAAFLATRSDGFSHVFASGSNKRGQLGSSAFGDQIN